ncbi:hypothetical protein Q4Q35_18710 [Flavivirga aquimarina]|uniref:Uncharacterized protein n=1 Tax=Flavivirga aquimarina TaxID=2027862 RepID=A0ABT8WFA5_9FLAO|nr:hypothetical protein [Flavivirga aquimarina]MDO5971839.1 hypothetical protein [Flavivirga aquimarina]
MKYLNYILIVLGAVVAVYAKSEKEQNEFVLIGGIIILMIGVYRVSRNVPSKHDREEDVDNFEND